MKHFLIIWYVMANGDATASVTEWDTLKECEETKNELVTTMKKGHQNGRWRTLIKEFNAVCLPVDDVTEIET